MAVKFQLTNQPIGLPTIVEVFKDLCMEIQLCICKDGILVSGSDTPDHTNCMWIPASAIQFLQWSHENDQEIVLRLPLQALDSITQKVSSPTASMSLELVAPDQSSFIVTTSSWAVKVHVYVANCTKNTLDLTYSHCDIGPRQEWSAGLRLFASLSLASQSQLPTNELLKLIQLLGHANQVEMVIKPQRVDFYAQSLRFRTLISVRDDDACSSSSSTSTSTTQTRLLKTQFPHTSCTLLADRLLALSVRVLKQVRQSQSCLVASQRPFLICQFGPHARACFSI